MTGLCNKCIEREIFAVAIFFVLMTLQSFHDFTLDIHNSLYDAKYPILLNGNDYNYKLIIKHCHKQVKCSCVKEILIELRAKIGQVLGLEGKGTHTNGNLSL